MAIMKGLQPIPEERHLQQVSGYSLGWEILRGGGAEEMNIGIQYNLGLFKHVTYQRSLHILQTS